MTHRIVKRHCGAGMAAICLLLGGSALAVSQVRIGVGVAVPGVSIGINIPAYPDLVPIPGYPVYYAPSLGTNLFFYDGLYWVLVGDDWYYSSWYDGPWYLAQPELVPDFILRIPILYYRSPPAYFLHWNRAAPPRWGEHWGRTWEERRRGWDRWDRSSAPQRAPLPSYQRQYPYGRYPGADRQRALENRFYPYTPRDPRDRSRLQQSPQFGQRIAPQPYRPGSQQQQHRPEARPDIRRAPSAAQRPQFTRPSPPARTEQRRPEANRQPGGQPPQQHGPDASRRPGAQPPQQRNNAAPQGRRQGRDDRQPPGH
jgi:hypothetical protein